MLAEAASSTARPARVGRAEGRSDGRFAGGRDEVDEEPLELVDAEDFLVLFCAATLRAGGAEDRLPVAAPTLCLVALTWPRAFSFFWGAFEALEDEDLGVLLVGIFTSSHPSPADLRA